MGWFTSKKKKKEDSLAAMVALNYLAMSVDGNADQREIKSMVLYWRGLLLEGDPGDHFNDWYDESGDVRTDKLTELAKELETSGFEFQHTNSELDPSIFPIIDEFISAIRKEHREIAIRSIVALCGSDLEWHKNELSLMEYVSKKLSIKRKRMNAFLEEGKTLVNERIKAAKEKQRNKETWDKAIKEVSVPGWKDEIAQFMADLYNENVATLLATSDEQIAKDVPTITPSKAKVIKKQMGQSITSNSSLFSS